MSRWVLSVAGEFKFSLNFFKSFQKTNKKQESLSSRALHMTGILQIKTDPNIKTKNWKMTGYVKFHEIVEFPLQVVL